MIRQQLRRAFSIAVRIPKKVLNARRVAALQQQRGLRLHFGCGGDRLPDFVNVDSRATPATDLTMDLNLPRLRAGSVALAFSNAFFEHLYRDKRLPHLQRVLESLQPDGVCCYMGLPYFRNIANFYLEGGPGTLGPRFDLYNVYRYTHGDPEHQPGWWLAQLHKSLFDGDELGGLLREAGFPSFVLFCYGYPGDEAEIPVTMGLYATRSAAPADRLRDDCLAFLKRFADVRIRLTTLQWIDPAT